MNTEDYSDDKLRELAVSMYTHCDVSTASKESGLTTAEVKTLLKNPRYARIFRVFVDSASGCTAERVMNRLAYTAFDADLADYEGVISGDEKLEDLRARGIDTRNIKSIASRGGQITKIELLDPLKALAVLGKLMNVGEKDPHEGRKLIDSTVRKGFSSNATEDTE